jgi:small-conductance mechanosensitive channel
LPVSPNAIVLPFVPPSAVHSSFEVGTAAETVRLEVAASVAAAIAVLLPADVSVAVAASVAVATAVFAPPVVRLLAAASVAAALTWLLPAVVKLDAATRVAEPATAVDAVRNGLAGRRWFGNDRPNLDIYITAARFIA